MPQKPPISARIKADHPLARGLVGFWGLGEGGGAKAFDSTRRNDGAIGSGQTWTPGRFSGQAAQFNGSSTNAVSVAQRPAYSSAAGMTVSGWAYYLGAATVFRLVEQLDTDWVIRLDDMDPTHCAVQVIPSFAEGGLITAGSWFHFAWVADGTNFKVFVNGELVASVAQAWTTPTGTTGIAIGGSLNPLTGAMENVAIHNRGLTDSEVRMLYTDPFGFLSAQEIAEGKAPAGGSTFSDTITETVAATDGFTSVASFATALAESVSGTDAFSVTAAFSSSLSESAAATDAWTATQNFPVSLSESVAATDNLAVAASFVGALSENATVTDSFSATAAFVSSLSETLAATDSTVTGVAASWTDSASASDSIGAIFSAVGSDAESVAATDGVSVVAQFVGAVTETVTAGDSYSAILQTSASLTETVSTGDGYATGGGTIQPVPTPTLDDDPNRIRHNRYLRHHSSIRPRFCFPDN